MSGVAVNVSVTQSPQITRLHALTRNPRGFMGAVGGRAVAELRLHFKRRDDEPNRTGFPKSHFWSRRIRTNTALAEFNATSATVAIAAPEFAQKLHGGTITPKEAKFLTIPARPEAAGKSPRSFANLRFIPTQRGGLLVAQGAFQGPAQRGINRIGPRQDGAVYYFLVKSATQRADPRALPGESMFTRALVQAGKDYVERETR